MLAVLLVGERCKNVGEGERESVDEIENVGDGDIDEDDDGKLDERLEELLDELLEDEELEDEHVDLLLIFSDLIT